jgi:hypothetical protein
MGWWEDDDAPFATSLIGACPLFPLATAKPLAIGVGRARTGSKAEAGF